MKILRAFLHKRGVWEMEILGGLATITGRESKRGFWWVMFGGWEVIDFLSRNFLVERRM